MYPGMAKEAREEGFDDIAEWFETLAKAEKSHAGRFAEGAREPRLLSPPLSRERSLRARRSTRSSTFAPLRADETRP
jgi:rubrerythrin